MYPKLSTQLTSLIEHRLAAEAEQQAVIVQRQLAIEVADLKEQLAVDTRKALHPTLISQRKRNATQRTTTSRHTTPLPFISYQSHSLTIPTTS